MIKSNKKANCNKVNLFLFVLVNCAIIANTKSITVLILSIALLKNNPTIKTLNIDV